MVEKLTLMSCKIKITPALNFPNLTGLRLSRLNFNIFLPSVLSLCPTLSTITLERCCFAGEIMPFNVPMQVRNLTLKHVWTTCESIMISASGLGRYQFHGGPGAQNVAVEALKYFVPRLSKTTDKGVNDITLKYLEQLTDANVAVRRGSALAIDSLPFEFLATKWKFVLPKLCSACAVEDNPEERDAEAQVNAVKGLISACETLSKTKECSEPHSEEDSISLYLMIKNEVMQSLFRALEDYSVDNRGDVGSWIREAAIIGLERCTYILCKRDSSIFQSKSQGIESGEQNKGYVVQNDQMQSLFDANLAETLVGGIVKQAVEKMDKIREIVAKVLQRILYNEFFLSLSYLIEKFLKKLFPMKQM